MEQQNKTIFLCEDSLDGILTGVYEAYAARLGHSRTALELQGGTMQLFADYRTAESDREKAEKVRKSICDKISFRAWEMVYRAAVSAEEDKADAIYRFLVGGFYYGSKALDMLSEPAVARLFELNRAVGNEAHYWREFMKYERVGDRILLARIHPRADVVGLEMYYFHDRMPDEDFMIWDIGRKKAGIHPAGGNWYLTEVTPEMETALDTGKDAYTDLWVTFFNAIAIRERLNPACQRNHIPLRYRETLPEFQQNNNVRE